MILRQRRRRRKIGYKVFRPDQPRYIPQLTCEFDFPNTTPLPAPSPRPDVLSPARPSEPPRQQRGSVTRSCHEQTYQTKPIPNYYHYCGQRCFPRDRHANPDSEVATGTRSLLPTRAKNAGSRTSNPTASRRREGTPSSSQKSKYNIIYDELSNELPTET